MYAKRRETIASRLHERYQNPSQDSQHCFSKPRANPAKSFHPRCVWYLQDNEISREQRRRQRTDKELRDVRAKLDLKTAEHEEVKQTFEV